MFGPFCVSCPVQVAYHTAQLDRFVLMAAFPFNVVPDWNANCLELVFCTYKYLLCVYNKPKLTINDYHHYHQERGMEAVIWGKFCVRTVSRSASFIEKHSAVVTRFPPPCWATPFRSPSVALPPSLLVPCLLPLLCSASASASASSPSVSGASSSPLAFAVPTAVRD